MIPDEAAEAAAKVLVHGWLRYSDPADFATAILEAAAPHLMAAAWEEGWLDGYADAQRGYDTAMNPYEPRNV